MIRVYFYYKDGLLGHHLVTNLGNPDGVFASQNRVLWDITLEINEMNPLSREGLKVRLGNKLRDGFPNEDIKVTLTYEEVQEIILMSDFPEPPKVIRSRFERIQ